MHHDHNIGQLQMHREGKLYIFFVTAKAAVSNVKNNPSFFYVAYIYTNMKQFRISYCR